MARVTGRIWAGGGCVRGRFRAGRPASGVEVAAEKNSRVIIVPVPVEMLRFLDRAASAAGQAHRPAAGARPFVQAEAGHGESPEQQSAPPALP